MNASLERICDRRVEGWVETDLQAFGELTVQVDGRPAGKTALLDVEPVSRKLFSASLPEWVFNGYTHAVELHFRGCKVGNVLSFQSNYSGKLDGVDRDLVYGWAVDLARPGSVVSVEAVVDGKTRSVTKADTFRQDLKDAGYGAGNHGFSFHLPDITSADQSRSVEIRIAGTDLLLSDDPVLSINSARYLTLLDAFRSGIRRLIHLASADTKSSLSKTIDNLSLDEARQLIRMSMASGSLADLLYFERQFQTFNNNTNNTQLVGIYSPPRVSKDPGVKWDARHYGSRPVDIVIPVHSGQEETIKCLQSVRDSKPVTPFEIVCVLDNPEDEDFTNTILRIAEAGNITILRNKSNLGFVKSVNLGMRLHADRDVVMLNADTVVHSDWLDRLRRAAYSSPEIGTATPFSNNATICSYPQFNRDNELPYDCDDGELDRICGEENDCRVVDLPTGVGFCMYIRRDCILSVGLLDEESFGKGYGEENDFCRLAANRGWRNVLAADTFVRHVGNVSFGQAKSALVQRNLETLGHLHPHYHELVSTFIHDDPIHWLRRRVDAARLRRATRAIVCLVTHELGGGTNAYMDRLALDIAKSGMTPIILRCSWNEKITLMVAPDTVGADTNPAFPNLVYYLDKDVQVFQDDFSRLPVAHFHFQTNINVPPAILDLPTRLGVPYDCTVHDYSWICPKVKLVDDRRKYCGEPPISVCERCIKFSQPHPEWNFDSSGKDPVQQLRLQSEKIFDGARRVFCPSRDVEGRISRYFPNAKVFLKPHDERLQQDALRVAVPSRAGEPVTVAVIGAIGVEKGSEVLLKCAIDAWKRGLPLRFVVIGYTNDDGSFLKLPNVRILGKYVENELADILRAEKLTLSFFPAVWPETYSYTLSIALRYRLFPIAFDLGAIAERIRDVGFGCLLPFEAADVPGTINSAFLRNANWMEKDGPATYVDRTYQDTVQDYYELDV